MPATARKHALVAMTLLELVAKHGAGAKLKRVIMAQRGWKYDDWYLNWPEFSLELEAAILEARKGG